MSTMQRRKGSTFERFVTNLFREHGAPSAKRGLGQSRGAGEVADVDVLYVWPECKHHIDAKPAKAHAQAVKAEAEWRAKKFGHANDSTLGFRRIPLAICKSNRKPPTVTLHMHDLIDLTGISKAVGVSSSEVRRHTALVTMTLSDFMPLFKRYVLAVETVR